MSSRPIAMPVPRAGLVARQVGDEVVIVNPDSGHAHKLEGINAQAWLALEQGDVDLENADVAHAVRTFAEMDLLAPEGLDRRLLLQRAGVMGAVGITTIALGELPAFASTTTLTATPSAFTKHTGGGSGSGSTTLTGSGYTNGGTVNFTGGGTPAVSGISPSSTTASGTGTINQAVTFSYPNGPGTGTITANDGTHSASANLVIN